MGQAVKIITMTSNEEHAAELRSLLMQFDNTKIIAEVEEPALLAHAVKRFPADILLVNLDPAPDTLLPIVGDVATANPNLAVFAVSDSTDGPLILKAIRLGIKEFLPKPVDTKTLGEAIAKVASTRNVSQKEGKLITVMGTAGGVGSTMVAINLAVELAEMAKGNVSVVDLDYRHGQVATMLDVDPTYTLTDVCGSPEQLDPSVMSRALTKHESGVKVLSRPNTFAEAETITAAACVGVFSILTKMSDFTVVDGPTRFDAGAKSILSLADFNLLVVQLSVPCVRNAVRILDDMRENGYNLNRTKLICNRVGRDAAHLTVDNVTETLGLDAFASLPDEWSTVSGAINLGEPLQAYSPKSKIRMSVRDIAERLYTPEDVAGDQEGTKRGLIGRIFTPG